MRALDGKILPARVDEAGARTNLNCMEEQLRIGAIVCFQEWTVPSVHLPVPRS